MKRIDRLIQVLPKSIISERTGIGVKRLKELESERGSVSEQAKLAKLESMKIVQEASAFQKETGKRISQRTITELPTERKRLKREERTDQAKYYQEIEKRSGIAADKVKALFETHESFKAGLQQAVADLRNAQDQAKLSWNESSGISQEEWVKRQTKKQWRDVGKIVAKVQKLEARKDFQKTQRLNVDNWTWDADRSP